MTIPFSIVTEFMVENAMRLAAMGASESYAFIKSHVEYMISSQQT
jgi:hypothetical protein